MIKIGIEIISRPVPYEFCRYVTMDEPCMSVSVGNMLSKLDMKRTTTISRSDSKRIFKKARGSSSSSESEESFITISADTTTSSDTSSESSLDTTSSSSSSASSGDDDPVEIIGPVQEDDTTVINPSASRQDRVVVINQTFSSSSFFSEKPAPLTHDPIFAIYMLDAEYDGADNNFPMREDALFSRSLRSYPSSTIVKKCHGPWGNNRVLENRYFKVKNSVFSSDGTTSSIILQSTCSEAFIVVLHDWFFDGWLDQVAVDTHDYFLSCQ